MRFAVKGSARCASVSFRTTLRAGFSLLTDPLPTDSEGATDVIVPDEDGTPTWVKLDRYFTAAERDLVRDRWRDRFADPRVLDGSRVSVHRCYHDIGDRPCELIGIWEKQGGAVVRVV